MNLSDQQLLKIYNNNEDKNDLPYPLILPNHVEDIPIIHIDDNADMDILQAEDPPDP